ncbi:hypothetical protein DCAR_0833161 [Daucus carota subsp. sativus]|uniref:Uncharacterized protein n=1 Tax=Daucus carota subsp. sativus TaxID=79200 RepID=A0A175YQS5_DAUCS|nr:PREDICTED: protein-tyrosine-phosphatase MKP1-like [Daucus carota subsp. sativus]WOH13651.1 hypothetical protein DCAR_0833161 [Daucus carota subsp. sativus]
MLRVEENDRPSCGSRKTYSRSASWSDRSPTNPLPRPQLNNKVRACLPPLQPLAISRPKAEEWPRAGSDDLGVWPNPTTPGVRVGGKVAWNNSEQSPREFEFRRDKIAFFEKDCSRIADHVYLGSDAVAKNREILRQNGITHVLNCVGFVCPEYFKSDLVYKTLWLRDSPTEDITSILYDVFDYFEDVREQGGRVLVHCCQGVSRSTSLVIAYLMWRKGQSFEDAFQFVKAARGVANPNMGFACQLLQCQKRVHAVPASPNSMLRMYRMAPHSPYDPLHLVPKLLSHPHADALDSRGAFIVHVPSVIYLWIGQDCVSVMSDNARTAALQVIRYEKAQGFISIIREGEESSEFWSALQNGADTQEDRPSSGSDKGSSLIHRVVGQRKVNDYDLDFEIFHQAFSGGVVPPSALFRAGAETSLPARENGWGRLRRKFANGIMKEFIASSKLSSDTTESSDTSDMAMDTGVEVESSLSSFATRSLNQISDNHTETSTTIPGPLYSPSPRHISSFPVNSSKFSAFSPSPSPSTSDYSSPFTFSPSSSNWSDLSYPSAQPSPSGLGSTDLCEAKKYSLEENAFSSSYAFKSTYLPCKGTSPSIAERRGTYPPPRMMLPSDDKMPQAQANLPRSWSFSLSSSENELTSAAECIHLEQKGYVDTEEPMTDVDITVADVFQNVRHDEGESGLFHTPSGDMVDDIAETTSSVLYQWPGMNEVQRESFEPNSESVYFICAPDMGFSLNTRDVLYIWIGQDVSSTEKLQRMDCDGVCEDDHIQWEAVGRNFITNKNLSAHSIVQIVKEGEEPEQLLKHLNLSSFHKAKELSNN